MRRQKRMLPVKVAHPQDLQILLKATLLPLYLSPLTVRKPDTSQGASAHSDLILNVSDISHYHTNGKTQKNLVLFLFTK